jgi:predicted aldo/keto reductase-like oxidoreductase
MEQTTEQIIADAYAALPPVVQDAVASADLSEKLKSLAQKHQLHLDKWAILENEIAMALLGITDPEDLKENIQTHVGIDSALALAIANDAAELVFNPIQEKLRESVAGSIETQHTTDMPVTLSHDHALAIQEAGIELPTSIKMDNTILKKDGSVAERVEKSIAAIIEKRASDPNHQSAEPKEKSIAADSSFARKNVAGDVYREQI